MPVVRISEEQKEFLDKEIERRFSANVSYRVVLAELFSEIEDE